MWWMKWHWHGFLEWKTTQFKPLAPSGNPIYSFSEQVIQPLLECLQGRELFASGGSIILFSRKFLFMVDWIWAPLLLPVGPSSAIVSRIGENCYRELWRWHSCVFLPIPAIILQVQPCQLSQLHSFHRDPNAWSWSPSLGCVLVCQSS